MVSSTWLRISRSLRPPVSWISRSASVDLPWSIWAIIAKLRILACGEDVMAALLSTRAPARIAGTWGGLAPDLIGGVTRRAGTRYPGRRWRRFPQSLERTAVRL